MKSIIAVNNLGYIGLNNKLLWKSSQDMSHFIRMTINQRLLVGHNTSQDLPKLINRTIIIDNRGELITDVDWCIGGKKTYEKYAPHFTELHISHIDNDDIGDIMFPDFRNLNPNCKIFNYYFK
jgi:dihydrofolate reductase